MFADTLARHMVTPLTTPGVTVTGVGAPDTKLASVTGDLALLTLVPGTTGTLATDVVTDPPVVTVTGEATLGSPPSSGARGVAVDTSPACNINHSL